MTDHRRGEDHPRAKLTAEAIQQARRDWARGVSQTEIARRLGVAQSTISRVVTGKRWTNPKA